MVISAIAVLVYQRVRQDGDRKLLGVSQTVPAMPPVCLGWVFETSKTCDLTNRNADLNNRNIQLYVHSDFTRDSWDLTDINSDRTRADVDLTAIKCGLHHPFTTQNLGFDHRSSGFSEEPETGIDLDDDLT